MSFEEICILKSELRFLLEDESIYVDLNSSAVSNLDLLRLFLTSGDVTNGFSQDAWIPTRKQWRKAFEMLQSLIELDPQILDVAPETSDIPMKLAVAIALTFSTPIYASDNTMIDPIERYLNFIKWYNEDQLNPIFGVLSAWQLRFVVSALCTDAELQWARDTISEDAKFNLDSIGEIGFKMVKYVEINQQGKSIHDGPEFYDFKTKTLKVLCEYGGVCGAISKVGSSICQAFGIPACIIVQPRHCAYLRFDTKNNFVISNNVNGWRESTRHNGVQFTWGDPAWTIQLMNIAQTDTRKFQAAERIRRKLQMNTKYVSTTNGGINGNAIDHNSRTSNILKQSSIAQLLAHACSESPLHYLCWRERIINLPPLPSDCNTSTAVIEYLNANWFLMPKEPRKYDLEEHVEIEISSEFILLQIQRYFIPVEVDSKFITVSSNIERAVMLVDGTNSEWTSKNNDACIVLPLKRLYQLRSLRIKWWGWSFAKEFIVLGSVDGINYAVLKTEADAIIAPTTGSMNQWSEVSLLSSTSFPTTYGASSERVFKYIKLILQGGRTDPWGMGVQLGIRRIDLYGRTYCETNYNHMILDILKFDIRNIWYKYGDVNPNMTDCSQPVDAAVESLCSLVNTHFSASVDEHSS